MKVKDEMEEQVRPKLKVELNRIVFEMVSSTQITKQNVSIELCISIK